MQQHTVPIELSRVFAAIAELGSAANAQKFTDKRVAVTAGSEAITTRNGRYIFTASIRLLSRFCSQVSVYLPNDDGEIMLESEALSEIEGVEICYGAPDFLSHKFDAVLCVGAAPCCPDKTTFVHSFRWLARVSSSPIDLPQKAVDFNPIAAYGASCLAVANVFKIMLNVKSIRALNYDNLSFSFYSFLNGSEECGEELSAHFDCKLLLVGAGAVGSAAAYILREMPLFGFLDVVDSQKYGRENFATTIYLTLHDIGKSKAVVAAKYASNNLKAIGHELKFESWLAENRSHISVVLTALDNIPARHLVQGSIWPDVLIDGATGSFLTQVIIHRWEAGDPCLMCLFEDRHEDQNADHTASTATGLSIHRVVDQHSLVTTDDINEAPAERKDWLRAQLGREICSVIQDGVVRSISNDKQRDSFAPAAPFVAGLSASMMISALYRHLKSQSNDNCNRFQFDSLTGPAAALAYKELPKPDCICQTRKINIDVLRRNRTQDF